VGAAARLDHSTGRWVCSDVSKVRSPGPNIVSVPLFAPPTGKTPCLSPYPGHHAPFRSPRRKLRVERFTLNVPDRYTGHHVCPHIWASQLAWNRQTCAWSGPACRKFGGPGQISCLSPYLGAAASLDRLTGAWTGPAGQNSGRPDSVSVPIFRRPLLGFSPCVRIAGHGSNPKFIKA